MVRVMQEAHSSSGLEFDRSGSSKEKEKGPLLERVSTTPRSLLTSKIPYVLTSHRQSIVRSRPQRQQRQQGSEDPQAPG